MLNTCLRRAKRSFLRREVSKPMGGIVAFPEFMAFSYIGRGIRGKGSNPNNK
jgi:hypothetical protein